MFPNKMLEFVSEDLYRATLHRVTKHTRRRIALVFELRPKPGLPYRDMLDTIISTCRVPVVEGGVVVAEDAPLGTMCAGADPARDSCVDEESDAYAPKSKKRKVDDS